MNEARVTTLSNGLRVVSEHSPHLETSAVGIWVDAGARNESAEVNGISHLLEHMAFKGTQRRSARQIAEEIEAVGGHLNAYTSREQTAYYARVLKNDVPLAVDLLADILQHSTFDPEELGRERQVIIQEIGQTEDTPDDIVFDYFQETAYPDQPIGRSILGIPERVERFTSADLRAYMAEQYHAPRMVLAAAGSVDHDELVRLAEGKLGDLPARNPAGFDPARYRGGDRRIGRDLEQVHVIAGFDGVSYSDPDYYVAQVYSTALGGGMSSRLFQEIREKRGLCYSIYSFTSSVVDGGIFGIYAGTGENELPELLTAMGNEVVGTLKGMAADEVERARAQLKAGVLMALESSSARCEQFARHLLIYGRVLSTAEVIAKIDAVDAAALHRYAQRLLCNGPPTLTALGPVGRLEAYDRFAARFRV
ncbi:MAG: insulinase family protein [Alphaproteobacteria bacterium]|nr:insulinase family protein [Alphaproteobacteria bacterium]